MWTAAPTGGKVIGQQIVIATNGERVQEGNKGFHIAKAARLDGLQHRLQLGIQLLLAVLLTVANVFDLVGEGTKDKHILLPNGLSNLDIGSIHGAHDEPTIQDKLHVARTRGLGAGRRNVLGEIAGGNDDFRIRDVVIGDKDHLIDMLGTTRGATS